MKIRSLFILNTIMLFPVLVCCQSAGINFGEIAVKKSADFTITGDGSAKNWEMTSWNVIPMRSGTGELTTKVKLLYSDKGIYFLFDCNDNKITAAMNADFLDLWKEDVVEVFLWTDENVPAYFEYEISPLNFELPILISNENGDLVRWMPFHYDPGRLTTHATTVREGEKKSNAPVSGWTAEFFIPYKLLRPLNNILPEAGTRWRANMYRVDYDDNIKTSWAWQEITKSFHDYMKFGILVFE